MLCNFRVIVTTLEWQEARQCLADFITALIYLTLTNQWYFIHRQLVSLCKIRVTAQSKQASRMG